VTAPVITSDVTATHHDRTWWRAEAIRTRTDMSSLLRQRIRVRHWVNAGRPPMAEWTRAISSEEISS
jgi:hypothetical protein